MSLWAWRGADGVGSHFTLAWHDVPEQECFLHQHTYMYILPPPGASPRREGRKRRALFPSLGPYSPLTHLLRIFNLLGVYGDYEHCSTSTTPLASLSPQFQAYYKYFSELRFFSSLHFPPLLLSSSGSHRTPHLHSYAPIRQEQRELPSPLGQYSRAEASLIHPGI